MLLYYYAGNEMERICVAVQSCILIYIRVIDIGIIIIIWGWECGRNIWFLLGGVGRRDVPTDDNLDTFQIRWNNSI